MEIWKDVVGFEGIYEVSSLGRVKRVKLGGRTWIGRILSPVLASGYKSFSLCVNNTKKTKSLHRLIAMAFIHNPKNKPEVNHKNGIKTDNRIGNLEWVTSSENTLHARQVLKIGIGEEHGKAKLKNKDIPVIRQLLANGRLKQREIGKMFGVKKFAISQIATGKAWTHII